MKILLSWDGHWSAEVLRMVEETDEEYQKRIKEKEKEVIEELKKLSEQK